MRGLKRDVYQGFRYAFSGDFFFLSVRYHDHNVNISSINSFFLS